MRVLMCESNYGIQKKSLNLSLASSGYNDQHIFAMEATIDVKFFSTIILNSDVSCLLCIQNSCKAFFQLAANTLRERKGYGWKGWDGWKKSNKTKIENDAKGMQLTWQM